VSDRRQTREQWRIRASFFPKRDVVKKSFFDKGDFSVTIPACLSTHALKNRTGKNSRTGRWWNRTAPPKGPGTVLSPTSANSKMRPVRVSSRLLREKTNRNSYRPNSSMRTPSNPSGAKSTPMAFASKMKKSLAAPHLALELVKLLGLDNFLKQHLGFRQEITVQYFSPQRAQRAQRVLKFSFSVISALSVVEKIGWLFSGESLTALCELRITKDKRTKFIIRKFRIRNLPRDGRATISWTKKESWRDWAALSEGCCLLRTNIRDWSAEDLWQASIQLTEAEAAFRIEKSDYASARSGIKGKSEFWHTFLFAFWPMFCGKPWA